MRRTRRIQCPTSCLDKPLAPSSSHAADSFLYSLRNPGGKREMPDHVSSLDSGTVSRCRVFSFRWCARAPRACARTLPLWGSFQAFSDPLHLNRLEIIRGEIETWEFKGHEWPLDS